MADFVKPSLLVPALRGDLNMRAIETLGARPSALDISTVVLYDFDTVNASALPHLAEQFNVLGDAGWDIADTDAKRRALLKEAVALHRIKGTPHAVKRSLQLLGVNATLIEWWQTSPKGDPHTFRIHAEVTDQQPSSSAVTAQRLDQISQTVTFWKRASSHFTITLGVNIATEMRTASVFSCTQCLISTGELRNFEIESDLGLRMASIFTNSQMLNSSGSIQS